MRWERARRAIWSRMCNLRAIARLGWMQSGKSKHHMHILNSVAKLIWIPYVPTYLMHGVGRGFEAAWFQRLRSRWVESERQMNSVNIQPKCFCNFIHVKLLAGKLCEWRGEIYLYVRYVGSRRWRQEEQALRIGAALALISETTYIHIVLAYLRYPTLMHVGICGIVLGGILAGSFSLKHAIQHCHRACQSPWGRLRWKSIW